MSPRLPGDRDPLNPLGPAPGPGPIGPRPPRPPFPPIPWTPFGPGDNAAPDVAGIEARAAGIRAELEKVQTELTGMRYGPGPDGTPPVVREVTRADGLWPFLVIRTYPGDMGKRPIVAGDNTIGGTAQDVVIALAGPAGEPTVVGRSGIAAITARWENILRAGVPYDVWVHVWNLGQFQATGVRVSARLQAPGMPDPQYLGGTTIDLGDRASDRAHAMVKAATFTPDATLVAGIVSVIATAECLADPATGDLSPGADRHTARYGVEVYA